jgi:hypothetical protein
VSRWLRSFGAFWYDFIVGDDWRGAAAVALALAATALLVHVAGVNAWWLMPVCVIAALGWSLRRATTRPTWVFTVASDTNSRPAISALDRPWATWASTSRSRPVRQARSGGAGPSPAGNSGAKRSIRRRVVDGATTASPECTARMPNSSSSGGTSLSRNPLAPALSAE